MSMRWRLIPWLACNWAECAWADFGPVRECLRCGVIHDKAARAYLRPGPVVVSRG